MGSDCSADRSHQTSDDRHSSAGGDPRRQELGFGKAASQPTEYIAGVMAQSTTQEKWAATPKYTVAVSGHSGGGFPADQAVAQGLKAEEVMLLDGINGFRELGSIITWVLSRLDDAASRSRPRAPTRPNRTRH